MLPRAPHSDCQRKDQIVVPTFSGIERQMTALGIFDAEVLQLAHQFGRLAWPSSIEALDASLQAG
ncbi:hypothetical protein [Bradyrhizobium sp. Ash2021]|uniref:hypothetical protein n=1 Tax=Bradyrhizobium sp. Ash2021 TaxID=2954771 RepID=UPI0028157B42|nr:hypothetical protein [Bradyrhizobium sp. Ash2021]WMT79362.1 hypothetical protein NL528_36585 [Bradyrhizobium sp. Ash2021]